MGSQTYSSLMKNTWTFNQKYIRLFIKQVIRIDERRHFPIRKIASLIRKGISQDCCLVFFHFERRKFTHHDTGNQLLAHLQASCAANSADVAEAVLKHDFRG